LTTQKHDASIRCYYLNLLFLPYRFQPVSTYTTRFPSDSFFDQ